MNASDEDIREALASGVFKIHSLQSNRFPKFHYEGTWALPVGASHVECDDLAETIVNDKYRHTRRRDMEKINYEAEIRHTLTEHFMSLVQRAKSFGAATGSASADPIPLRDLAVHPDFPENALNLVVSINGRIGTVASKKGAKFQFRELSTGKVTAYSTEVFRKGAIE